MKVPQVPTYKLHNVVDGEVLFGYFHAQTIWLLHLDGRLPAIPPGAMHSCVTKLTPLVPFLREAKVARECASFVQHQHYVGRT